MSTPLIIDTDTHVNEPRDLWTSRMSRERWGDLIPEVRWIDDRQGEYWCMAGKPLFTVGTCIMVPDENGRPIRSPRFPDYAQTYEQMHPSAYVATERLKVLDSYGIQAAALFPNLGFVGPNIFAAAGSDALEFQTAALQAYNDFLLEWCSADPDRLLSLALIPYWDVDAAVAEIERCAALGHKGLVSTGKPQEHGQPLFVDPYWDRMWAAAQDAGLSISFHVGGGDLSRHMNPERIEKEGWRGTLARLTTSFFLESGIGVADLLMSGVLARFPRLRFVSVESAIGWIPFLLESLDFHFKKYEPWVERPEFAASDLLPSDYFRRQVFANFWYEKLQPWHVEAIGTDNLLFETDYPHQTCLTGDEITEAIDTSLSGLPEADREKVLWRNAASLYNLDVAKLEALNTP
ncbi:MULTISPECIES: amidohydrolase family protein [Actinomadura]|uniref:Predicted metal-dependent hydrolase, TIM-barrel fold n=1 Tax=Actinomadura madurae TaxID=1993 RepID=A0A1I5PIH1_9ACTN|nr:amidohydrolase family protein [Actinomadura madurae]SFP33331.1 Predicted metal-dependent hydrolase, TIM-barrel fold [Actinomadura madurae]SPT63934.1 Predicted metal-dependent hydrolase of the TIM-barrel fold [Actinomadura madurae]